MRVSILNVATEQASRELIVSSANWFDLRERLTGQIIAELAIKPSESERQKMSQQDRISPAALESYRKAIALQDDRSNQRTNRL